ncbi:MAG: hypothetical protein VW600_00515 [Ferrovibrio sp.]
MNDIHFETASAEPAQSAYGRRVTLAGRLQAAFGAFVAPEKFTGSAPPVSNDNSDAISFADPLALPPGWHGGDLLSLSFLPFDR